MKKLVKILLIVGGLNWGIIGLTGKNLVCGIFCKLGGCAMDGSFGLERIVYILVGIAALLAIKCCISKDSDGGCCGGN